MTLRGSIILLNGASSAGKSTLACALQPLLPRPFWHYSIDHLAAAGALPPGRIGGGTFPWSALRPQVFEGFHNSLPALAAAGNDLIVEHIVETQAWMHRLLRLLGGFDVFFVGLHCPLETLRARERARGDRRIGEAGADFEVVHTFGVYDFECASTEPPGDVAGRLLAAWRARSEPSAFSRMAAGLARGERAG